MEITWFWIKQLSSSTFVPDRAWIAMILMYGPLTFTVRLSLYLPLSVPLSAQMVGN